MPIRAPRAANSKAVARPIRFAQPVINATFPFISINKVVIITGASRGIGLAIARKFHQQDASVVLCARSAGAVRSRKRNSARNGRSRFPIDVRDTKSVQAGVQRDVDKFGRIDVVVNNAGILGVTPIDAADSAPWIDIINTNIVAAYNVTSAAIRHMPDGERSC